MSVITEKHSNDRAAIMSAVMNAERHGGASVDDVDAVAGASLGVEGIIELGRKAMQKRETS